MDVSQIFANPKIFSQLYTVNVFKGEATLPCVYALLPDKTTETYIRLFDVLIILDLHPQSAMAGFEFAAINALEEVFEYYDVNFCLYHLSKNAFSDIQSKHLHAAYHNEDARVLLRFLPALAFLPVQHVTQTFDDVKYALPNKNFISKRTS